jgi:hypothetical protein
MEQKEKEQQTNEEKKSQGGCCDFSSEKTQEMFKMMRDFCGDSEKGSSDCCSMMEEMMKNMSSKSDGCGFAEVKNNLQTKSNKSEAKVENGCC